MKFIHYSDAPLTQIRSVEQSDGEAKTDMIGKPAGLWFCAGDRDGWKTWCEDNDFNIACLTCQTEIIFTPKARLLRIADAEGIDAFTLKYQCAAKWARGMRMRWTAINWRAVAEGFDAIIIAPYICERRLFMATPSSEWYYSWDCACGCVWNADAVAELRQMSEERI